MAFIVDYFGMDRGEFVRRYFVGRQDILEMATTEVSHRRILTDLQSPEQQAIVASHGRAAIWYWRGRVPARPR